MLFSFQPPEIRCHDKLINFKVLTSLSHPLIEFDLSINWNFSMELVCMYKVEKGGPH